MTDLALTQDELQAVVEAGTFAPSVHNTQPWSFVWAAPVLSVFEDASRALPVLDPSGRERVISCGAAIVNARLALAALGKGCEVQLLPDPSRPQLLARVRVRPDLDPDRDDAALAPQIARRHTDRGIFDAREVPVEAVRRLAAAAEREGGWVRPVERLDERVVLAVLLSEADEIERQDPAYAEELAHWRTHERAPDGVPDAALGQVSPSARASEFPLRDFAGRPPTPPSSVAPPPAEHPLAVIVGTDGDDRVDWLLAGMALGRVLLEATLHDLAASPMTQVVEIEPLRRRLRRELGLIGVPQVVLRLGFGYEAITTRRRPVDEVLRSG